MRQLRKNGKFASGFSCDKCGAVTRKKADHSAECGDFLLILEEPMVFGDILTALKQVRL